MAAIRYVCLSDMHLGEEDSLLTNLLPASTETDPLKPSPVLERLTECLRELIAKPQLPRKPTLVLNGDIFEFALATDEQAAMAFERFIDLVMPANDPLFEKIIYVPGNHDHHLWESARETQYVDYLASDACAPGKKLPAPWHATNIFVENDPRPVTAYFPTRLVRRYPHLKEFTITAAYPNFGLLSQDKKRCILFHHGHFTETIYLLMSYLKNMIFPDQPLPEISWDVETENYAWIDFLWSALGRSGKAGRDVELIYDKLNDPEAFKKLLYNLADGLARKYDLPGWGDKMESAILKAVFGIAVDQLMGRERRVPEKLLSDDGEEGLRWYLNTPLCNQILTELDTQIMLPDVTFVFGHTHKPFQTDMNFKNYPGWVNVYNSGGWVVDTIEPQPLHGGAVILIDEELNAASLRVYNENTDPTGYRVSVAEAMHAGESPNPLCQSLRALIKPDQNPWKAFSTSAARAVYVRAQNLRAKIREKG
jgi:hypothetical protein